LTIIRTGNGYADTPHVISRGGKQKTRLLGIGFDVQRVTQSGRATFQQLNFRNHGVTMDVSGRTQRLTSWELSELMRRRLVTTTSCEFD